MPSITGSFHDAVSHSAVREVFISYHSLHRAQTTNNQTYQERSETLGIVLCTGLGVVGVWVVPNPGGIRTAEQRHKSVGAGLQA